MYPLNDDARTALAFSRLIVAGRATFGGLLLICGLLLTPVVSADKLEACERLAIVRLQSCFDDSTHANKQGCWFASQSEYHQCQQQQNTARVKTNAVPDASTTTATAVPITEVSASESSVNAPAEQTQPVSGQSDQTVRENPAGKNQTSEQEKLREVRTIRDIM